MKLSEIIEAAKAELSDSDLALLISAASNLLMEKQASKEEGVDVSLSTSLDSSSISNMDELRRSLNVYFTDEFTSRYLDDEVAATDVADDTHTIKRMSSLEISLISLSLSQPSHSLLVFKGLNQAKCRLLLENYFQLSTMERRGSLSVVETILNNVNEEFTLVNLSLGENQYWSVSLRFSEANGLQFFF